MSQHKLEVLLNGEFTTVDIRIEGFEIGLIEINDNEYYKMYSAFATENPIHINVHLEGWASMDWELTIKIDDVVKFNKTGTFTSSGYASFVSNINL